MGCGGEDGQPLQIPLFGVEMNLKELTQVSFQGCIKIVETLDRKERDGADRLAINQQMNDL